MEQITLIDKLYMFIKNNISNEYNFFIGGFYPNDPNKKNCASLCSAGGANKINEFIDGSYDKEYPIEFLVKDENQKNARNLVTKVSDLVNNLNDDVIENLVNVSIENEESYSGISEDDSFIYTVLIKLTVFSEV